MTLPPIALTCGEPAGIGPEIAVAARARLGSTLPFFFIGDPAHLPAGSALTEIATPGAAAEVPPDRLPVLAYEFPAPSTPGRPAAANAAAVVAVIEHAVRLVQEGSAAAVVTNPIHKKALQEGAGFAFPGHTEFLASLGGVERVVMMLACPGLKAVPVTIHVALSQVPAMLDPQLLRETLRITHHALQRDFGVPAPRLAVSGLNPHAGEGGAMGREEIEIIAPVIAALQAQGMAVTGPHAADSMFHEAARAQYDAAVCMYHDQALIPLKTLDFAGGVNITLGLPFTRCSPDHGTALDIAGQDRADPSSLVAALRQAHAIATRRHDEPGDAA